jgi:hypothetical protein
MTHENIEGFEIEYRDYSQVIDGRFVLVEKVPYLRDPDTDELFLHASTAQQLFDIIHGQQPPYRHIAGEVFAWQESELKNA